MSGEQSLFRATLWQAWSDACLPLERTRDNYEVLSRKQARDWLLYGGSWFRMVCEFAGYEPTYVQRRAKMLEDSGWEPGERRHKYAHRHRAPAAKRPDIPC